jgi:alpha-L-arabinofuranosidase
MTLTMKFWSGLLALMLAVGACAAAGGTSLTPPVFLPDGQEFKSWEAETVFSRTYYVDQQHPLASDDNPGAAERPFRTIGRAARLLQPGERVVIGAGLYRERVTPSRGGTSPDRLISYEAAPGAEVIISGSEILPGQWSQVSLDGAAGTSAVWTTHLPSELFPDGNPFAEVNLTDAQIDRCMDWAVPIKGKPPITLRRGLVFQNGQRLKQVAVRQELAGVAGTYWVETNGLTLHVHPLGGLAPNRARFEVTTRSLIFAPAAFGLGYIRVKGLTIEHSGNCFPRPQQGALSAQRGHHWIIEENTVRQCNAIGIDVGDQFDTGGPGLAEGGRQIVRRNRVSECGVGGIEGKQIEHTLIEGNIIRRCGWHNIWPLYETGGIKVHCTRSCLLWHNVITDTVGAPGIWLDYANVNSRCAANVIVNADCSNGGIFMEASQQPNLVDDNFVWGTRGAGIYQHDCDELVIAHNLVGASTEAPVRMQVCLGRKVGGRLTTARRNRVVNNIFVNNGSLPAILDPDNVCDWNLLAGSNQTAGLEAWRESKGWDKHSLVLDLRPDFDPATLRFAWKAALPLPTVPAAGRCSFDLLGRPRDGAEVQPGPFASGPEQPVTLGAGLSSAH